MLDIFAPAGAPNETPPATGTKNPAAVALGRLGGLKGGKARADALSPEQRAASARAAAKARWDGKPPAAASAEPWKPWANRVLEVFDADPGPFLVSCSRCREEFATDKALGAHHVHCAGTHYKCAHCERFAVPRRAQAAVPVCDRHRADGELSRDAIRSRRHREVRATTISVKRMTKREIEVGRLLYPEGEYAKPQTRAECVDGPRPCPYVSCKWHLYLDIVPRTGAIKLNFPDLEPDQLKHSCALDIADEGGRTLEDVAAIINVTRERIRQLEVIAFERLRNTEGVLPSVEDFEYSPRSLPVLHASDVEETESAPFKPVHSPATEAANQAERAAILAAELGARGAR